MKPLLPISNEQARDAIERVAKHSNGTARLHIDLNAFERREMYGDRLLRARHTLIDVLDKLREVKFSDVNRSQILVWLTEAASAGATEMHYQSKMDEPAMVVKNESGATIASADTVHDIYRQLGII